MDTHLDASGFIAPQLQALALIVLIGWAAASVLFVGLVRRHAARVLQTLCPHSHARRTAPQDGTATACHWCGQRLLVLGDTWMREDRFRAWVRERS